MPSNTATRALRDLVHHIDLAASFAAAFDFERFRDEMAAAGNTYRHDYEDVAASCVWVTLQNHLPPLRAVIDQELAALKR